MSHRLFLSCCPSSFCGSVLIISANDRFLRQINIAYTPMLTSQAVNLINLSHESSCHVRLGGEFLRHWEAVVGWRLASLGRSRRPLLATMTKRHAPPLAFPRSSKQMDPATATGRLSFNSAGHRRNVSERSPEHGRWQDWRRQTAAQILITQSGHDPNTLYAIGKTLNCARATLYH